MFTMIFVNDLAGVSPTLIPWWMRHFKANGNGMTFVDLVFRHHRTALLGSIVLLFCLYPADRAGLFRNFWLSHYVGIGETLGSAAIARSASCALLILAFSVQVNRSGFRLRL